MSTEKLLLSSGGYRHELGPGILPWGVPLQEHDFSVSAARKVLRGGTDRVTLPDILPRQRLGMTYRYNCSHEHTHEHCRWIASIS